MENKQTKEIDIILLLALLKTTTDYSTLLIGELKQKPKQEFNLCFKQIDKLISELEKNLMEQERDMLQGVCDCFHEIVTDVKKQC